MTRTNMTVGQRIVELLRQEGVDTIFSQGDITTRDVLKHAERAGLATVGPRHEAAAVFAAMGHYAVSGRPQAAFGAMGPGVANLLPATVAAATENLPVIVFGATRHSGVVGAVRNGRWLHAPMLPLFERISKSAARIHHPAEVDEVVQQAFRSALSGTPGPAYVEYDAMMHVQAWDYPPLVPPERYRAAPREAPESAIAQAAALLREAKSPILLGGEAIQHRRAQRAFLALGEALGCPILATFAGSGIVPWSHPQALLFESAVAEEAIGESDLLLAVGTGLPEGVQYGRLGPFARGEARRKVVVLDADAARVGVNRPVDLAVVGDVAATLPRLAAALGAPRARSARMEAWHRAWRDEMQGHVATIPATTMVHPSRLMVEARAAIPDDTTIVLDGGLTIFYQHAFFEKRGADFVYGAHYSHLGCGLPQAVGAQLAQGRDRPVCLITGDGALGFHFMEFETAVRHRLPIVVVVNDDRLLGAEMAAHMQHIGHPIEVGFAPVRYDEVARAMGGHGERVDTVEAIQPAIRRAFASGVPAIVQVLTDPDASHRFTHPYAGARRLWINADVESKYGHG